MAISSTRTTADSIDRIVAVNRGRDPALLQRKFTAMAQDPFAFLRATAMLGHRSVDLAALPRSPLAWICGDLHLQNFGCFRGGNRLVYFDLNDFDEAARLPAVLDLMRFLASISTAAPVIGLTRTQVRPLAAAALAAYAAALVRGKAFWLERDTAGGSIGGLLQKVQTRKRRSLLDARTVRMGRRRVMALDPQRYRAVAPADAIRDQIHGALEQMAQTYGDESFFAQRDLAFRIAGMGSLGVARYVALVHGKGDPDRNALIDFKFAPPSSAAQALPRLAQPVWPSEAARVVAIQAASPAFLSAVTMGGRPFVARELQPVEDRVSLLHLARDTRQLGMALDDMARLAAFAQLRSASRRGADGIDAFIDFGAQLQARPRPWLDAARAVDEANTAAFRQFRGAWAGRDARLHALCAVAGPHGLRMAAAKVDRRPAVPARRKVAA